MISRSLLQAPALPTELSGVYDPQRGSSSPDIIPSASPQVSYLECQISRHPWCRAIWSARYQGTLGAELSGVYDPRCGPSIQSPKKVAGSGV